MKKRTSSGIEIRIEKAGVTICGSHLSISNIEFNRAILPSGANGMVFEAYDTLLRRSVAVKIWIPSEGDARNRKKQALAEASKIAQLTHNNIVRIYSAGAFHNGWIYSVMEYLDGNTVRDFLALERPDFMSRVRVWREIEAAVEYAHRRHVYHGDLHDRNVMVVGGTVKVIDFGTSLFALKRKHYRSRESKMLYDLAKEMFSECEPKPEEIVDLEITRLRPELALSAISAWVSVLCDWQELLTAQRLDRETRFRNSMDRLAFDVCYAPVFSIPQIVELLTRMGVPPGLQDFFVTCIIRWAEVRLSDPGKQEVGMVTIEHDLPFDRQALEARLKTVWQSLRSSFIKVGPFEQ